MHEGVSQQEEASNDEVYEREVDVIIELAKILAEREESFPFPGIDAAYYEKIKSEEEELLAAYPDLYNSVTPIDELMERCENEGVKVVLGNEPENLDIFILPVGSNDIKKDSIFLWRLTTENTTDMKLLELIALCRKFYKI